MEYAEQVLRHGSAFRLSARPSAEKSVRRSCESKTRRLPILSEFGHFWKISVDRPVAKIVGTIVFLALLQASCIEGQVLAVNGGPGTAFKKSSEQLFDPYSRSVECSFRAGTPKSRVGEGLSLSTVHFTRDSKT